MEQSKVRTWKWTGLQIPAWMKSAGMLGVLWCLAEGLAAALLSRGVLLGKYAPLGVAWAVATAGTQPEERRARSYASLLGAVLGYCVAAQVDGLRYAAAAVLGAAIVMIFREMRGSLFLPAAASVALLSTGAVYAFTGEPTAGRIVLFVCEGILTGVAAYFYAVCRRELGRPASPEVPSGGKLGQWELYRAHAMRVPAAVVRASMAMAAVSVCITLGGYAPLWGIRLGHLAALLGVLCCTPAGASGAASAGLLLGGALDLCVADGSVREAVSCTYAAIYGFLGLFGGMYRKKGPFGVSIAFVLGNAAALPWLYAGNAAPLFEGFAASVLYLTFSGQLRRVSARLFPTRGVEIGPEAAEQTGDSPPGFVQLIEALVRRRAQNQDEKAVEQVQNDLEDRLDALRAAFAALRTAASPAPPAAAAMQNPGAMFTFAAERTCRGCSMRDVCWNREYTGTRNAFNDATAAILRRGSAAPTDFPPYFAARCLRLAELVGSINDTLSAMRYQQRFRRRVREDNRLLCAQYDGMLQVLDEMLEPVRGEGTAAREEVLRALVGVAERCKDGEETCGDTGRYFKTPSGRLFLLISDGMGSGAQAGQQSAALAQLLELFLQAGVEPATVLRLVCPAFALSRDGDSVASIDLLDLDLCSGEAVFYKCGAAPSWVLREGASPRRIGAGALPAGMPMPELAEAEVTRMTLRAGDRVVMVSDGVEGLPVGTCSGSPGEMAEAILNAAAKDGCSDDMTVMVCGVM